MCRRYLGFLLTVALCGTGSTAAAEGLSNFQQFQQAVQGAVLGPYVQFYTTRNVPADYVIPAGAGHDGVVALNITRPGGNVICSGQLLPTGRHILCAAHCVCDLNGVVVATAANVDFHLAGGVQTVAALTPFQVHPSFNGNPGQTPDLAIIRLAAQAPSAAERRYIYRGTAEIGQSPNLVGYGNTGNGSTGAVNGTFGTRRGGSNRFDAAAESLNGVLYAPGTFAAGNMLAMDFDSGNSANDALNLFLGIPQLGSAQEVSPAGGDSGGPGLLGGKIAGVVQGGQGFNWLPDVTPNVTDSSFGELAFYTRVSTRAAWHDQVVPDVVRRVEAWRITPTNATYAFPTGSGEQLRTVAFGGVRQLRFRLSEHLGPVSGFAVTIRGMNGLYPGPSIGWLASGDEWEVRVDPSPGPFQWTQGGTTHPGDALEITLSAVEFAKPVSGGAQLDGDFSNPTSLSSTGSTALPSGNGSPGTNFVFRMILLPADLNRDNLVDVADLNVVRNYFGATGASYAEGDTDGDGDVDLTDYNTVRNALGINWTTFPY